MPSATGIRVQVSVPRAASLAFALIALLGGLNGTARAEQGDVRAGLFLGTTTYSVGGVVTTGTSFGGNLNLEINPDLYWSNTIEFSSTGGRKNLGTEENPVNIEFNSASTAYRPGLLYFLTENRENLFIPFVAGGLSLLDYDFEFPDTDVGTVSGSTVGTFAMVGVEIRLTQNFYLIPRLGVQWHRVKTESGDSTQLISGGLSFSLRIAT